MLKDWFKIYVITGGFAASYPFLIMAPILFLLPEYVYVWVLASLIFMQGYLLHPLQKQREMSLVVFLYGYPVNRFLRSNNIITSLFTYFWFFLVLIPVMILKSQTITFSVALTTFFLLNTLLFMAFTLGNKIELSAYWNKNSGLLKPIVARVLFLLLMSTVFCVFLVVARVSGHYKIMIMLAMLMLSFIVWLMSLRKTTYIKSYFVIDNS